MMVNERASTDMSHDNDVYNLSVQGEEDTSSSQSSVPCPRELEERSRPFSPRVVFRSTSIWIRSANPNAHFLSTFHTHVQAGTSNGWEPDRVLSDFGQYMDTCTREQIPYDIYAL